MTIEEKASQIQKEMHSTITMCMYMVKRRSVESDPRPSYNDFAISFIIDKLAELELRIDNLLNSKNVQG